MVNMTVDIVRLWERDAAKIGRKHNPLSAFEIKQRAREVWKLINVQKGDKCLDVGCGGGYISVAMALEGGNVVSFDINEEYIRERVIPMAKENRVELETYVCDMLGEMPFKGRKFDWIVAVESIEHAEFPYNAISGLKKYLKSGGRFVVTIPNIESFYWKMIKFAERHKFWKPRATVGRKNHKEFTRKEAFDLVRDFKIAGYKKLFSSHLFVLTLPDRE